MNHLNFSCFYTHESFFSNRLYVGLNQDHSTIQKRIFESGKENKGLGMTSYGTILGQFFVFIGIAFKTCNQQGSSIYINKKSFCNLIDRLYENNQHYNYFNPTFMDQKYQTPKNAQDIQRIQKIRAIVNAALPASATKNIGQFSLEILSRISQKPRPQPHDHAIHRIFFLIFRRFAFSPEETDTY